MSEMKLLFDQNISFRVIRLLAENFADCQQVRSLGLNDCTDMEIWRFAKQHGFSIVTFDADFFDISILRGFPPKIIWLRTGNLSTSDVAERILLNSSNIASFIDNPDQSCLEIL
jgi:predicted nuclease of predicted toxin-antitoxin system